MFVTRIVRMHGHRGVAEHRLGPSRRETDELVAAFHRVAERPEAALDGFVINLVVSDGGLELRIPIDQPLAAIDQAVAEHLKECCAHRSGTDRIEREARALPITATAKLAELAEDAGLVLVLPLPDALDEFFAAEIVARLALFFAQTPFHHGLRSDAGMIGAW